MLRRRRTGAPSCALTLKLLATYLALPSTVVIPAEPDKPPASIVASGIAPSSIQAPRADLAEAGMLTGSKTATRPDPALQEMRWRLVGPFRGGWSTAAAGVPDSTPFASSVRP